MSRSKPPHLNPPTSLVLTPHELASVVSHAEGAYPEEACGLIVGSRATGERCVASRIVPSANVATGEERHRFEIDPVLRLRLERELRDTGETVIGHYHSHPDHPGVPSARDLKEAHEPELVWLIIAVDAGKASACRVFRLEREAKRCHALALHLADDGAPSAKAKPRRAAHKPK
ncbi:MAG: M67 family peptidase [Alphaproteobacteria bacterium]|nr:M67 family peptidase [Alphaproteobacteria bacterium]